MKEMATIEWQDFARVELRVGRLVVGVVNFSGNRNSSNAEKYQIAGN